MTVQASSWSDRDRPVFARYSCSSLSMAMRPPSLRGQRVREGRGPRSERAMRFGQRHRAEAQALARFHLSQAADVERTDRRHLRVTAGGLAVDEERDGLGTAWGLDAAECVTGPYHIEHPPVGLEHYPQPI